MRIRSAALPLAALAAAALGGCAQPSCANHSVLDALDSTDRDGDLAHVGLLRDSATTRLGPGDDEAQCSIWERLRAPGTAGVALRPQYYSVRLVNNGWVMEK